MQPYYLKKNKQTGLKKYILSFSFLLFVFTAFSQKQANIWYFGNKAGLDFNQSPPAVLNNAQANSQEGSSTMSDNNGRLLFYTNGKTIMNRKHEVMLNGSFIRGEVSSTDNTITVPLPGNDSVYYLFTVGSAQEEIPFFSFSIIDMKGDGGFGAVTVKNNFVADTVMEKLAAIRHCNKKDFWIVVRKWDTDAYYSYLLTSAGFSGSPVISHTGLTVNGVYNNSIGTLKFSSKGNKLAAVHSFFHDAVELMDFDNTTGIISNPVVFNPNTTPRQLNFTGSYGAEFSPDGKLLYVSSNHSNLQPSLLFQFDITSNNAATITASKQLIANSTPWFAGDLQLGPDSKIYMAMWNDTAISVIENPNVYGAGCNFNFNKIYLANEATAPLQFGLPTFMQSYFDSTSNPYDFSRQGDCLNKSVTFVINRVNGIDSVKWDFGDGQQSQTLSPTNTYLTGGFYDVKLIVYKVDCSLLNDTINRRIWIADTKNFLGPDTSGCNAATFEIGVEEIFGVNYLWNTGYTGSKITTSGFSTYWLEMEQNGCKMRDSLVYTEQPKPVVNLGPDTSVCLYKPIILYSGINNADSYLWSTGETTPSITVKAKGTYYVTVDKGQCIASDTVKVTAGDCDVFIPSAFTPNKDNLNETFGVVTDVTLQYFSLQIYSKWGQLIFNTNDVTQKWDGTFKGKDMPNGAYFWMMNYTNLRGKKYYEQGMVMLIR